MLHYRFFYIYLLILLFTHLSNAQPALRWGIEFDLTLGFVRTNSLNWCSDGSGRIVIAAASGDAIAVFDLDGEMLPGWPTTETEDWWIHAGPRLGDVTGDGEINVVVLMRSYWADSAQLRVYDLDCTSREEFTKTWLDFPSSTLGVVVLSDIDDDGIANIICTADSIHAFDSVGQELEHFPRVAPGPTTGEAAIIIPESMVAGKALVTASDDSIDVESLSTFTSLPGWPRPFSFDAGLQTQPVVFQYLDSWSLAIFADDSLYVWDNHGNYHPGFPLLLGTPSEQCRDFSVTDINQDGIPELSIQKASARVWIIDLEGHVLAGYPWNEDRTYKGFGEDVLSLHIEGEDSARICFPADLRIEDTNQYYHGVMSLEGSSESEGFPIYNDRIEANYFPTTAIIWTGRTDTLHIMHLAPYGYLSRFDLPLPGASVKLIWPMPGGNPGGNRVYDPGPYVGVKDDPSPRSDLPTIPTIRTIYPNPGNAGVRIEISLPGAAAEELVICNVLGQVVWSTAVSLPGPQLVPWSGEDFSGNPVSSGRYFAYLSGNTSQPSPITIVR